MNEHKGLVNRLLWAQDYYMLNSEDAVLQKTTFSFDVSDGNYYGLYWQVLNWCSQNLVVIEIVIT